MKHLRNFKLFESVNKLNKMKATYLEWSKKLETFDAKSFSDSEKDFFNNLLEINKSSIYELDIYKDYRFNISLYQINSDSLLYLEIDKLEDYYYVIHEYDFDHNNYYICDQFEEVIEFLGHFLPKIK